MARDNGHNANCAYCDRRLVGAPSRSALMATRDHIEPKSRGGRRTVWACFTCNNMKGCMSPVEWRAFMTANPEWWKDGPKPHRRVGSPKVRPTVRIDYLAAPDVVRALARRIVIG